MEENMFKILMAEDDINLGAILKERLKLKGYDVVHCPDGETAYQTYKKDDFDLLILDIMMPLKDGFTVAKEIRDSDSQTPIIFVSARNMNKDILKGFDIGADDYITKPFSMEELLVRIQAVLKRSAKGGEKEEEQNEFEVGKYHFNYIYQTLSLDGHKEKLTSKEADLLKILCENKNDVVMRDVALKKIWGDDTYFNGRSMDVFISKLRKLISSDGRIEIMNVHGKGFKLIERETEA